MSKVEAWVHPTFEARKAWVIDTSSCKAEAFDANSSVLRLVDTSECATKTCATKLWLVKASAA